MGPVTISQTPVAPASNEPAAVRAYRSPAAWTLLICVLLAALAVDLITKQVAFPAGTLNRQTLLENPDWSPSSPSDVHLLEVGQWKLLDLRLVINRGAVFGIGANRRAFFIAFTVAALCAGLLVFGRFTTSRHKLAHIAIGMILAGGIGNLYDRIVYGVVRDFLHMLPGWELPFGWRWPGGSPEIFPWVFNAADATLLLGMGLLMIHINRVERVRRSAQPIGVQPQSPSP